MTSATNTITLSFAADPSNGAAILSNGSTAASSGVATFNALSIDTPGTGYQLAAAASGLSGATSNTFNIQ
ncbi:MAG TPA: hypothetical protein VEI47_03510 [Gemmatimonadales bacterium]|nr:hypothetical protein [Gemmatimonadales bacterium]